MSPFRRKHGSSGPADANLARDLVERLGGGGERTAFSFVDELGIIERFTFADVGRRAAGWAGLLRDNAVTPGDRVLVLAGRDAEWRPALLGALEAGAVAAVCPASTPLEGILDRARQCGATLIVSAAARPDLDAELSPPVLAVDELRQELTAHASSFEPVRTAARDVALVLHEEELGGLRGITHTHGSLLAQALAGEQWLAAGPGVRVSSSMPDGSPESVWTMLAAWGAAAELVVVGRDLDAEGRLEFLHGLPIDVLWLAPDEYRALAQAEHPGWYDLSSIRLALSSPAVDDMTAAALQEGFGLSVGAVYGLPETGVLAATAPGQGVTGAAVGSPLPGLELGVVDERGRALQAGEEGELVVQGGPASLFSGYWNAPRATAAALRNDTFRTGARAAFAADGSLRVSGRRTGPLELVAEPEPVDDLLLDEEPVAAPLPHADPIVRDRAPEAEKLSREERRRRREAEALRRVAERARLERDELERLRRARDERLVEEQRKLEARRLREQGKAKHRTEDRTELVQLREDEELRRGVEKAERQRQKAEAKRIRQEEQLAAEQRRRAEEEARRERDRTRREEKEAAQAAKRAAAEAKAEAKTEAHRQREEAARAEREREAAAAAERARLEAEERQRQDEERRRAEEAEREQREREAAAAAAAEQARLEGEQRERQDEERRRAEQQREREAAAAAEQARLEAEERERQDAERRRAEEAEREQREREAAAAADEARREAEERAAATLAAAENRRRAEETARLEHERRERETAERLEREQAERREREEREREEALATEHARLENERQERQAEERRQAAEAGRLQAEEEDRRRAEESARAEAQALLREAEERRRREVARRAEVAQRRLEEAERDRRAVEEVARKEQVAAQDAAVKDEERRRRRLASSRQRPGPEPAAPNPDLLARIGRYGMTEGGPAPGPPEPETDSDNEAEDSSGR